MPFWDWILGRRQSQTISVTIRPTWTTKREGEVSSGELFKAASQADFEGRYLDALEIEKRGCALIMSEWGKVPIRNEVRIATYMWKAGMKDASWARLNQLMKERKDTPDMLPMEHSYIYKAMAIQMRREKRLLDAIALDMASVMSFALGVYRQKDRPDKVDDYICKAEFDKTFGTNLKRAKLLDRSNQLHAILVEEVAKFPRADFGRLIRRVSEDCRTKEETK